MPGLQGQPKFIARQVSDARYFYLDLDPAPDHRLSVICGGCEHCLPQYAIKRESFPFFSLEYVLQGTGTLRLNGDDYALGPGSVFTYGPGIPHEIVTDAAQPLVKYFIDFTGPRGMALLTECELGPGHCADVTIPYRVMELFESVILNGQSGTEFSPRLCRSLVEVILLKVAENRVATGVAQSRAFSTYLRARLFIEEHFLDLSSLVDISAGCHVAGAYLCRLFSRFDSQTPYQKLTRMKMNRAAELLTGSGRLVKDVADELGYEDPYHFSRVFKKVYGLSPDHFLHSSARLGHTKS